MKNEPQEPLTTEQLANEIVALIHKSDCKAKASAMLLAFHILFGETQFADLITGHRYLFPSNS